MIRTISYITIILAIWSCSSDNQITTLNSSDSLKVVDPLFYADKKPETLRYCSDEELRDAGYGCISTLPRERRDWMRNFKMICSNYKIKKKEFLKFVDLINKMQSYKIHYDKSWIENFNDNPKAKEWIGLSNNEQIATIIISAQDSVPILIGLTTDSNRKLDLSLCIDSSNSRQILELLTKEHLVTTNIK
jgi:hypothetical protein